MTSVRLLSAIIVSIFVLSPVANAASGTVLPDLSPVDDILDAIEDEETEQEESTTFQTSPELFPAVEDEDQGGLEERRDERTAGFLVIRVGSREVTLRDVPLAEWFAPYVRAIAELQLVSGYRDANGEPTGLFGPADSVTLEQVAKVVSYGAGLDIASCPLPPKNLTASGTWSGQFVSCAEKKEWVIFADASVDVHRPATRSEVVVTVLQAFDRTIDGELIAAPFKDVELTSPYAPTIAQAKKDGIVSGYTDAQGVPTGEFGPDKPVTRAEFSKIVSVALQIYK